MVNDIIGKRYGKLVVEQFHHTNAARKYYFICRCDCGNTTIVRRDHLTRNETLSCGCLHDVKNGLSSTRLHRIWYSMVQRCYAKENKSFPRYGMRGISICKEWISEDGFNNFYVWALENGYEDNLTIDRIDSRGNYEPSNCRWANIITQNNNKSNNIIISANGETHTLSEWASIIKIPYKTLYARYLRSKKAGGTFEININ